MARLRRENTQARARHLPQAGEGSRRPVMNLGSTPHELRSAIRKKKTRREGGPRGVSGLVSISAWMGQGMIVSSTALEIATTVGPPVKKIDWKVVNTPRGRIGVGKVMTVLPDPCVRKK